MVQELFFVVFYVLLQYHKKSKTKNDCWRKNYVLLIL